MKKYFVFSDVHGCFDALIEGLNNCGFDKENDEHIIISCGDNFDRGNQNYEMYKFLRDFPKHRKLLIRGNHEYMLRYLLVSNIVTNFDVRNGVALTYDELIYNLVDQKEVIKFIDEMHNYVEINNHIFVHGFIPNNYKEATLQDWYDAVWVSSKEQLSNLPKLDKMLVVGHIFSNKFHGLNEIYYKPKENKKCGLIAIDSMAIMTSKVNIFVLNEDGTYDNDIHKNTLKQIIK